MYRQLGKNMRKNTKMNPVNINTNDMNNPMGFVERTEVEAYINKIRKFEPLTREEKISLIEEIRKGNENAFNVFVERNLLLAYKIAKRYMHNGVPFADLIQAGNIGLIKAVRNYAFEIGVKDGKNYKFNKFSSMAVWYIRKEITESIENEGSPVRRPHLVCNASLKIGKVIDRFDHEPPIEELVDATGLKESEIIAAIGTEISYTSTDVTVDDSNSDHSDTYGDLIAGNMHADDTIKEEDTHKEVEILMATLDDKERLVVRMTYGIGYDYERDFTAIGEEIGCSPTTVKNIMKKAVAKMQKAAVSHK